MIELIISSWTCAWGSHVYDRDSRCQSKQTILNSNAIKNFSYILNDEKILYTGDFSRVEDRHLMAAELPTIKPDVLIIVIWHLFY